MNIEVDVGLHVPYVWVYIGLHVASILLTTLQQATAEPSCRAAYVLHLREVQHNPQLSLVVLLVGSFGIGDSGVLGLFLLRLRVYVRDLG